MDSSQESETMHLMTCRLTAEETASIFDVDPEFGLDRPEVHVRRTIHQMIEKPTLWEIYLRNLYYSSFMQLVILLMLGSAVYNMFMMQFDNVIRCTVVIVIAITIHFVQVYRHVKSMEALMPQCHCRREGKKETFIACELVPADIVELCAGDRVPADLRLTQAVDLAIDESILTGETLPSLKTVAPVPKSEALNNGVSNMTCMAFLGTLVMCGRGQGIVIGKAENSEFDKMMEKSKMKRRMTCEEACRLTVEETASIFDVDPEFGLDRPHIVRQKSFHDFISCHVVDIIQDAPLWKKYLKELYYSTFIILVILVLLGSAVYNMFLRQFNNVIGITVALVAVSSLPFFQVYNSEKSMKALNKLVPQKAKCHCLRDGKKESVFTSDLLPGDIVELCVGDHVPADLRLTQAVDLAIDEIILTSQLWISRKTVAPVPKSDELNNGMTSMTCIAFMGTRVICGCGQGIVIGTAENSELFNMMEFERFCDEAEA